MFTDEEILTYTHNKIEWIIKSSNHKILIYIDLILIILNNK